MSSLMAQSNNNNNKNVSLPGADVSISLELNVQNEVRNECNKRCPLGSPPPQ